VLGVGTDADACGAPVRFLTPVGVPDARAAAAAAASTTSRHRFFKSPPTRRGAAAAGPHATARSGRQGSSRPERVRCSRIAAHTPATCVFLSAFRYSLSLLLFFPVSSL